MKKRSLPSWANKSPPPSAESSSASLVMEDARVKEEFSSILKTGSESGGDEGKEERNYLSPFEMSKKRKIEEQLIDDQYSTQLQSSDLKSSTNDQKKEHFSNLIKPRKEFINKYVNFFMKCKRIIFLDCETTGFTKNDQVIELAAIEVIDGIKTGLIYNTRIKLNENVNIHEKAFEVHKISEQDLESKPSSSFIYTNFIDFLNGNDKNLTTGIVAHNVTFDMRMIKQDITKYLLNSTTNATNITDMPSILTDANRQFCTMSFYKNIRGKNHSYDLDSTLHYFGINKKQRQDKHAAIVDTELTFELFKSLQEYIEFNIKQSIEEYYPTIKQVNSSSSTSVLSAATPVAIKPISTPSLVSAESPILQSNLSNDNNQSINELNPSASNDQSQSMDTTNDNYSIFSYIKDLFNWF